MTGHVFDMSAPPRLCVCARCGVCITSAAADLACRGALGPPPAPAKKRRKTHEEIKAAQRDYHARRRARLSGT